MEYQSLRQQLQRGRRVVFDPLEAPCDLPEDPDWPTPTDWDSVHDLLERLPRKQRTICALTAAEMVLPVWEEWAEGRTDVDVGAPLRAIQVTWAWIHGEVSEDEVLRGANAIHATADAARAASAAVEAIHAAANAPNAAYAATYATEAAAYAAATSGWWPSREVFYYDWWARCRARLAFWDVTTAEVSGITWRGTTGTRQQYQRIRAAFQPREQRFDPLDVPELPEDPEWPAPFDLESTEVLLERLRYKQQVVCALIAAEMVLPIWEEWARGRGGVDADIPRRVIGATWAWVRGDASRDEVAAMLPSTPIYHTVVVPAAASVAYSAALVAATLNVTVAAIHGAYAADASGWWPSQRAFLQDWWSRCRTRLSFRDVTTAEVSGRTTGTAADYEALRERMEHGGITRWKSPEVSAPELSEDPEWPTPTDWESVHGLLERLPHKQRTICALTAAEMALPVWEEWATGRADVDVGAPRRAIQVTWAWIRGDVSEDEVLRAGARADADANAAYAAAAAAANAASYAAADAANAAFYASEAAAAADAPEDAIRARARARAASYASYAAANSGWWPSREAFLQDWWSRCRARLSFRDVTTAEVSGRGTGTREQYEQITWES